MDGLLFPEFLCPYDAARHATAGIYLRGNARLMDISPTASDPFMSHIANVEAFHTQRLSAARRVPSLEYWIPTRSTPADFLFVFVRAFGLCTRS